MHSINEQRIRDILGATARPSPAAVDAALTKTESLARLSLEDAAVLMNAEAPGDAARICAAARRMKQRIYGNRIVLFAPLYISNFCANDCLYCGFRRANTIPRTALDGAAIEEEARAILRMGHKRILMVAGEGSPGGERPIDYYVKAVETIYRATDGKNRIRRVNVNCAPLTVEDFRKLKTAGIGTYQLFQETYHEATYRRVHPAGPKSDPDNRIMAIDRAFEAGIDDVGVGILFGLYDWRFEALALLMHVEHLERTFGVGPHTISAPRIEPARGAPLSEQIPSRVSDDDFKRLIAVLRLAVPYTGIILSTRETPAMRDELVSLGVSQISAGSNTAPGGYDTGREAQGTKREELSQFSLNDHRSLDEIVGALIERGLIPSFCTACYRSERTGEAFMDLAKPGMIKNMCSVNALVTLKEYLEDYASPGVKEAGCRMIERLAGELDPKQRERLDGLFAVITSGGRDAYV